MNSLFVLMNEWMSEWTQSADEQIDSRFQSMNFKEKVENALFK